MKDLPLNTWMAVRIREDHFLAYATQAPNQPIVVRGEMLKTSNQAISPNLVHRLMHAPTQTLLHTRIFDATPLDAETLKQSQLGPFPHWAPREAIPEHIWRDDQRITFHPKFEDECEVLFHDDEKRKTELLWARIHGHDHDHNAYDAEVLNTPTIHQSNLEQGSTWSVRSTQGSPLPFFLTPQAKVNLKQWSGCCDQCGFDLMFSPWQSHCPIEHLNNHTNPPQMLTVPCLMCRGTMLMLLKTP